MSSFPFLTIISLLFLFSIDLLDSEEDVSILELTDENFNDAVNSHSNVFVEFYAPWCSHCQALAPEYLRAAKVLKNIGADVILAKVDATTQTSLASKYGIKGYPTIILFKGEKQIEYNGDPTATDIVAWIEKKFGPRIEYLQTLEEYNDLQNKHSVYAIVLDKDVSSSGFRIVESVADNLDIPFYHCNISSISEEYGLLDETKVILMKNFDEPSVVYEGVINFDNLSEFLKLNSIASVFEFTEELSGDIFGGEIKKHLMFFSSKSDKRYEEYKDILKDVIADHRTKASSVIIDCDIESHERILAFFGIKKHDCPVYRLIEFDESVSKYKPEVDAIAIQPMRNFLLDAFNGKVEPYYMSEDVPDDWDARPIKVLVAKNFNQVTQDRTKSVLVIFYAPWCGHCQQILPIWEQLAAELEDISDIMIAKLDATTNEIPDLKIEGFPTIKLFPKDSDEVIDHSNERTFDGFKKLLEPYAKKSQEVSKDVDKEVEPSTKKAEQVATKDAGKESESKTRESEKDDSKETNKETRSKKDERTKEKEDVASRVRKSEKAESMNGKEEL